MADTRINQATASKENFMIPVLHMDGTVKGYRYVMSEHVKDTYLEKNNSVDTALGNMGGNMVDKVASTAYNEQTIDALHAQFLQDFHTRPDAYVNISASSTDPRLKEIWQLMPRETRKYVQDVFGSEGMLVREDLVDLVFGQRKISIVDAFETEAEKRNLIQKVIVNTATMFMGERAASKLKFAEDWVQEIVGELKQNIIVKTFMVTLSNAISNSLYLKMAGMSVTNIIKYQAEAYSQAFRYQEDIAELDTLELKLSSDSARFNTKENRERVAELRDAISNNPVTELMDAGVLQTVVEDAQLEDLDFTNRKGLMDKLDDNTQWVPTVIKDGVKQIVITKDTKIYKLLNNAALLSDFSSRYALYKQYTTVSQQFDKETAIARVMDEFVNFDLPTHKFIQYLNDMGLLWFSKYMIRIQKILTYRLMETPVAALSTLFMAGFNGTPTPFDAAVLINRNPLSAFGTPLTGAESLGNTITQSAVESLIP
jgi:DNA-binding Lrp family transcriptional regulator